MIGRATSGQSTSVIYVVGAVVALLGLKQTPPAAASARGDRTAIGYARSTVQRRLARYSVPRQQLLLPVRQFTSSQAAEPDYRAAPGSEAVRVHAPPPAFRRPVRVLT
jgi:hypothetical protein